MKKIQGVYFTNAIDAEDWFDKQIIVKGTIKNATKMEKEKRDKTISSFEY